MQGKCKKGATCTFAHGVHEIKKKLEIQQYVKMMIKLSY